MGTKVFNGADGGQLVVEYTTNPEDYTDVSIRHINHDQPYPTVSVTIAQNMYGSPKPWPEGSCLKASSGTLTPYFLNEVVVTMEGLSRLLYNCWNTGKSVEATFERVGMHLTGTFVEFKKEK